MSSAETISVVIPAYRAERFICRAVNSVLHQTVMPDEILIVDDGSPQPLELGEPHDGVRILRKPNGGAASARNYGIARATGRWIALLDADDYWEPSKLERQIAVVQQHPEVQLLASRFYAQEPGEERKSADFLKAASCDRVIHAAGEEVIRLATQVWTGTVMARRDLLLANPFVSGLEPAEDRDVWMWLLRSGPAYFLSDYLSTEVLEPGSLCRSNIDRDCTNMLRVIHRHADLIDRRSLRRWQAWVLRKWAAGHLGDRRYSCAVAPAAQRLYRQPASPEAWWILMKSVIGAGVAWSSIARSQSANRA